MRYRLEEIIPKLKRHEAQYIEDEELMDLIVPKVKNLDSHIELIEKKIHDDGHFWYYLNKSQFAKELGISRVTLDRWLYLGIAEQYSNESTIDVRKTCRRLKELKNKKLYKNWSL